MSSEKTQAPPPDAPHKPDEPTELDKPAWKYTLKRTVSEFSDDQCTDLAAGLTYHAVLSLFPALVAIVSLLGVFGQGQKSTNALLGIVKDLAPSTAVDALRGPLDSLTHSSAAGPALILGLLGALWSASGYVGAFSRAMNRIYEIREGRPFWKLRPTQILITLIAVGLTCLVLVALVFTGPLAQAVGNAIGLGSTAVTIWQIAKWPVMLLVVVLVLAILYYATPNVKQPKFQWISPGALVALVVWAVASALFAVYVANFSHYNKTYGALSGIIVFLLWLWITNLALLFGAEFNSEMERGRELQAGMVAEDDLQLPPRDTRKMDKREQKVEKERAEARAIRESSNENGSGGDDD